MRRNRTGFAWEREKVALAGAHALQDGEIGVVMLTFNGIGTVIP
jgi:hypothetical protein